MPTVTDLIISPADTSTLVRDIVLVVAGGDANGVYSAPSATIDGIALPALVLVSGVWQCPINTRRIPNGTFTLTVSATYTGPGAGSGSGSGPGPGSGSGSGPRWEYVTQSITVTISNTLQSGVEWDMIKHTPIAGAVDLADCGVQSLWLPAAINERNFGTAVLMTDQTPSLPDLGTIDTTNQDAMAALFALGQPVAMGESSFVAKNGTVPQSTWRFADSQILNNPGTTAYLMLQLTPEEVVSYYTTGFSGGLALAGSVISIKRNQSASVLADTITPGTEVFDVLAAWSGGCAVFEFTISGTLTTPVLNWVTLQDLTAIAPDAQDFCVVGRQLYVVRASSNPVYVFDLDSGHPVQAITIIGDDRSPSFLENCAGVPVLICVNTEESGGGGTGSGSGPGTGIMTSAYSATFDTGFFNWSRVWTMPAAVTAIRWAHTALASLSIAVGESHYTSLNGTAAPVLVNTFGANITALGTGPVNAPVLLSYIGLADGSVWLWSGSAWVNQVTLASAALSVSAWAADGETARGDAGYASAQLYEQDTASGWGAGETLIVPSSIQIQDGDVNVTAPINSITALQGVQRIITPASGVFGDPGYVPAVCDFWLLFGTQPAGLFGFIQRSPLSQANGAFEIFAKGDSYLFGYPS